MQHLQSPVPQSQRNLNATQQPSCINYSHNRCSSRKVVSVACASKRPYDGAAPEVLKRREVLLSSFASPIVIGGVIGSDDPTTIINSILGGYGLPKLPNSTGYKLYDEFQNDYFLEYPRSWVIRPNTLRSGVYISDFNTADKCTVEVLSDPGSPEEAVRLAVSSTIVPGFQQGQQDDKLVMPSQRLIKVRSESVEGREYTYLDFPSETITRSGYNIRRRNFAVAVQKRGNLYVCAVSARSDQFNKEKEELLRHVVASFRVR